MTGNLIGETFEQTVFDQIKARQKLYASGFSDKDTINKNELVLLNNNNSFLKLASGVNLYTPVAQMTEEEFRETDDYRPIADLEAPEYENIYDYFNPARLFFSGVAGVAQVTGATERAQKANAADLADINKQIEANNKLQRGAAIQKLKRIGFSDSLISRVGIGNKLSKELVLFGGTSRLSGGTLKPRSGINKGISAWNNSAYGLGGSKFGKQPMPAIISAEIKCINRGSIRSATVKIKAFNQYQFDLIELLYLRLGYTMLLEWGHVNYIDNNNKRVKTGSTLTETFWFNEGPHDQTEVLDKIKLQIEQSNGNLDAFFGRVTNFNWSISPDGSYDITLELYTVGDVIESLTVNVPVDLEPITEGGEGKSLTILDKWMDTTVATMKAGNLKSSGGLRTSDGATHYGYIMLPNYNINQAGRYIYDLREGWDDDNSYFCTFRNLIEKIEEHTIPIVIGKTAQPLLDFNTDIETNIMSAQPNQVSFDLETCFIKPKLFFQGASPLQTFNSNDFFEFHTIDRSAGADLYYGKIMNIYLNFKFIKKQLRRNVDSKGRLSLYKFLKGICDGINSALGEVSQLEPIIKDDRTIVFIDQVQPRGSDKILEKLIPQIPVVKQTPFILYGFKDKNKSNFIYDFSFESTISSDLAAKLAIGATAGNTTTSIIDGTGFSSWNTGLQDRFSREVKPGSQLIDTTQLEQQQEDETEETLRQVFNGERDGTDDIRTWNPFNFGEDKRSGDWGEFSWRGKTFREFKASYNKFKRQNPDLRSRRQFESNISQINYPDFLIYNFSGQANNTTNTTSYDGSNAVGMNIKDKSIYNQGKAAFKLYIKQRDERIFKYTNTASGQDGFIPLNLQLNMLGLSGMKIYQQLPVDISFLPTQYIVNGNNLINFLIENIDHKISNNKWETSIKTLSIPRPQPVEVNLIDNSLFTFLGIETPPTEFSAYAQDVAWSAYFISWLNENIALAAQNSFPSSGTHTRYAQNIREGVDDWEVFDPRVLGNRVNQRDTPSYRSSSERYKDSVWDVYNYGSVKVGDIILRQRDGNQLTYETNPWSGNSHGDIVVEVTDTEIICIGGNLSDTVKQQRYKKIDATGTNNPNRVTITKFNSPSIVWRTKGAIAYEGMGTKVIAGLRCKNTEIANQLAALAKQEYNKWKTNNWTDASEGAFATLYGYYTAANGLPPSLPPLRPVSS